MKSQAKTQAPMGKHKHKQDKHRVKKSAHVEAAKTGGPPAKKEKLPTISPDYVAMLEEQLKAAQSSSNNVDTPMRYQAPECTSTKQVDNADADAQLDDIATDSEAADPKLGTGKAARRARATARNHDKRHAKKFEAWLAKHPKHKSSFSAAEVEPANAMQDGTDADVVETVPNAINADAIMDKSSEMETEAAVTTPNMDDAGAGKTKSHAINTAKTGDEPEGVADPMEDPILARAPKGPAPKGLSRKHAGDNTRQHAKRDHEAHDPEHVIDETAKDIGPATTDARRSLPSGSALGTHFKAPSEDRAASYGRMPVQCNSHEEVARALEHSPLQTRATAAEPPAVINGVVKPAEARNDVDSVMSDEAVIVTVPAKRPGFERERLEIEQDRLVVEEERLKMAKERFDIAKQRFEVQKARLKLEEQ